MAEIPQKIQVIVGISLGDSTFKGEPRKKTPEAKKTQLIRVNPRKIKDWFNNLALFSWPV